MSERTPNWERVKDLVGDALELEPEVRSDFLRVQAGHDTELLAQAESLLASLDDAGEFLGTPPVSRGVEFEDSQHDAKALVGTTIGQYRIIRFVAEGGMGAVYEAVQEQTGRTVALKLMRQSLGDRGAHRRFRAEVDILARLQHPAIAQMFDAGMHADTSGPAVPYFVMEFIDGVKLTQYVEEQGLSVRSRLELLMRICEGVHFAHQKGIVHRDLKPDNILVDASRHPKILDFGIARITSSDVNAATMHTEIGQILGTISYMSPEQVTGDPDAIDVRADVYALGVIIFQTLTGELPHDLRRVSLLEAVRIIRETDAPTMVSLSREYRGDIDTIVAKALEKDKDHRYQSASELAADIRRMLADEPILARPPSAMYQLRKFARRNRGLVAGVAAAFVVLVAGVIGTTVALIDAREEWQRAETALAKVTIAEQTAAAQRDRAMAAEQNAARERDRALDAESATAIERDRAVDAERQATAVAVFLEEMMATPDPEVSGRAITMKEVIDLKAGEIDTRFADDPAVAGRLHSAIGWTYFSLGEYSTAERHMRRALSLKSTMFGPLAVQTLDEETHLAQVLLWNSQADEADTLTEKTLRDALEALGPLHETTILARQNRATYYQLVSRIEESLTEMETVIAAWQQLEGQASNLLTAMNLYGTMLTDAGYYEEAYAITKELYELKLEQKGELHPDTVLELGNRGSAAANVGRTDEALEHLEKALEQADVVWGEQHPHYISTLNLYGSTLTQAQRYDEALAVTTRQYQLCLDVFDEMHAETVQTLNNQIVNLMYLKRFEDALPLARTLVERAIATLGEDAFFTWKAMDTLGNALSGNGEYSEAAQWHERSYEIGKAQLGPDHPSVIVPLNNYAFSILSLGEAEQAVELFRDVLNRYTTANPHDAAGAAIIKGNVALALFEAGQNDEALTVARETLLEHEQVFGPDAAITLKAGRRLARVMEALNLSHEARTLRDRVGPDQEDDR
ncbi:MAG: protein kinase domain-containing protein [Phycisphaerales bacterium]